MTSESLYVFFKTYFNYPASGKVIYARAISEAMGVIRDSMSRKDMGPIQKYLHRTYSLKLTKDMLHRLVYLAMKHYQDPFSEIQYFKVMVSIDKSLITTNHRGINIPIEGGWDNKNNKLIILTFSQAKNMKEEVRVIKGLLKEFPPKGISTTNIKIVAYWDLSKGQSVETDYLPLQPIDRQSLIEAANRIK
jgi:hypothetical protein